MDTQNMKDEENIRYIESVSDFLKEINDIGEENEKKNTLFYRGHSDKTYELKPYVYREEKFIRNEHNIYRDIISNVPYDFKGKSTIESLALMQHYGVPTRLLDLTTNPLVALYFACERSKEIKKEINEDETSKPNEKGKLSYGEKDLDGEVIILSIPDENIRYFDSDRIAVLANLAKCKSDFNYEDGNMSNYKKFIEKLNKNTNYKVEIVKFSKDGKEAIDKVNEYIKNNKNFFKETIDELMTKLGVKENQYAFIEEFKKMTESLLWEERIATNNKYFGELLHLIKEDKSYFQNIINPNDVGSIFAIKPKLDNPRIVRQYGAFLIFGVKKKNKEMPKVENNWIIRGKESTSKERLIIKSSEKKSILDELDTLGINKSTLFPEIDKVADYIKEKYTQK